MRFGDTSPPGPQTLPSITGKPFSHMQEPPHGKLEPSCALRSSPSTGEAEIPGRTRRLQQLAWPSSPPSLSPGQAKWGHGERKPRGGRQAGEEVISPQLAPLPRSLEGRRKPPGPPPVARSPQWSGLSPHPPGRMPAAKHPRLLLDTHPLPPEHRIQAPRYRSLHPNSPKFKSLLHSFPETLQASVSPSVKWSQEPLLHSPVRCHRVCMSLRKCPAPG